MSDQIIARRAFSIPVATQSSFASIVKKLLPLAIPGGIVVVGLLASDWIASLALACLIVGVMYLRRENGPPIVAVAFANQWLQVTAGVIYFALSGRMVWEMRASQYRPMVLIGIASVAVLFTGFCVASGLIRDRKPSRSIPGLPWNIRQTAVAYVAAFAASGVLTQLAWQTSQLTQAILVLTRFRPVLLFLLITKLMRPKPRWGAVIAVLGAELVIGFAGYFADFREPLAIAAIAIFGAMDRRKIANWIAIASLALTAITTGLIWTSIKPVIRKQYVASQSGLERLNTVAALSGKNFAKGPTVWQFAADSLVSRIWAVYYPSLAMSRVPSLIPHENGAILNGAIENVTKPRIFFPEKAVLPSQSDEVRKYAGVWVAGREKNTSYAFGYVGEAYVDFGVPYLFVPILLFGIFLGLGYRVLSNLIRHDDLRFGVLAVLAWSTLGMYEVSWVMWIGPAITRMVVIGGAAVFLDRLLARRGSRASDVPVHRTFVARTVPARRARVA